MTLSVARLAETLRRRALHLAQRRLDRQWLGAEVGEDAVSESEDPDELLRRGGSLRGFTARRPSRTDQSRGDER